MIDVIHLRAYRISLLLFATYLVLIDEMFTEPLLEPVEAAMALIDLSERPAQAVRLGEQEDIKASQDQI